MSAKYQYLQAGSWTATQTGMRVMPKPAEQSTVGLAVKFVVITLSAIAIGCLAVGLALIAAGAYLP